MLYAHTLHPNSAPSLTHNTPTNADCSGPFRGQNSSQTECCFFQYYRRLPAAFAENPAFSAPAPKILGAKQRILELKIVSAAGVKTPLQWPFFVGAAALARRCSNHSAY
jgi:hypothetical protein